MAKIKDNTPPQTIADVAKTVKGIHVGDDGEFEINLYQVSALGIDSEDVFRLRGEILEQNVKIKNKIGKELPQVLVPHHAIRIYRHIKEYDDKGWYKKNSARFFPVMPHGGMRDILGFKFKYSYDKPVTDFTMTVNNFRGKNRHTFASGDVVEFYFQLIDEETLKKYEMFDGYNVASYRYNMMPPLVFTGMLESIASSNTSDGVTLEWKGRSGGYILTDTKTSVVYPLQMGKSRVGSMLYEEIIWDIVTEKTGMIVGEVDLGQRPDKYLSGEKIILAADKISDFKSDLMSYVVTSAGTGSPSTNQNADTGSTSSELPFEADIKKQIENILINDKTKFCYVEEIAPYPTNDFSIKKDDFFPLITKLNQDAGPQRRARWSALLDYDLMKPLIISPMRSESVGNANSGGAPVQGQITSQLTGDYHYQSTADPAYWFKTEWAMEIFDKVTAPRRIRGAIEISKFAKIRTMFAQDGRPIVLFPVRRFIENGLGRDSVLTLAYNKIYGSKSGQAQATLTSGGPVMSDEFKTKILPQVFADMGGKPDTRNQNFVPEDATSASDLNYMPSQIYNSDYRSREEPIELQNPENSPFDASKWLAFPAPGAWAGDMSGEQKAQKYSIVSKDGNAEIVSIVDVPKAGEKPKDLIKVKTSYAMKSGAGYSIELRITPFSELVSGGGGASQVVEYVILDVFVNSAAVNDIKSYFPGMSDDGKFYFGKRIPNRVDIIAQTLALNGFEVTLQKPALENLKQKVQSGVYKLAPLAADKPSDRGRTNMEFEANGSVDTCINNAMAKFFNCVAYVDEFNILHVRPRFKHLQKPQHRAKAPEIPPIWGLYTGHPLYPRVFKVTANDALKTQPNSIIIMGESPVDGGMFVKADHRILQTAYGTRQIMDEGNESFNNKYEAKNIANNKLLEYIRNGYTVSLECDLIPELRPGHRINLVDFVTGAVGQFLVENINWEYSKESGIKMALGVVSLSLQTEDVFTSTAVLIEGTDRLEPGYLDKIKASLQTSKDLTSGMNLTFDWLVKKLNVTAGQASSQKELEQQQEAHQEFADKALPEFGLERTPAGIILFSPRQGFEADIEEAGIKKNTSKVE